MSRYKQAPLDLSGLKTVPLEARGGKVAIQHFAQVYKRGDGIAGLVESLPHLLAADSFRAVVSAIHEARLNQRAIIWGLGGHVIKCGLAPVLLDLMRNGWATAFALNGSSAIHDFEIALAGHTSEDVEAVLPDGRFGSAEETGREYNQALIEARAEAIGAGEALGRKVTAIGKPQFLPYSLLAQTWQAQVPVTVHIAVGTDTPHTHPHANAEAIGHATHHDFRLFCSLVRGLDQGGVYVNVGSAVVLPEVFLKAVSAVRNLGHSLTSFTTVNLDFLQHYRPRVNVVERPHAAAGGKGYALTGHHELMLPLLAAALVELHA